MWTLFTRCLQTLGVLIAILLLSIAFLLGTAPGARFLLQDVAPDFVEGLDVGAVEGALLGRLDLRGVSYEASSLSAMVDTVSIEWQPSGLLRRVACISSLEVNGLDVQVSESKQESEPFTGVVLPDDLSLPVTLCVENAAVNNLAVLSDSSVIRLASLSLSLNVERETQSSDNWLKANWSDITLHAADTSNTSDRPVMVSPSGNVQIDGQTSSHHSALSFAVLAQNGQAARVSLLGEGDQRGITLKEIQAQLLEGKLIGTAEVDWSQPITGSFALEGSGFDPAQWDERVPGELALAARATFTSDGIALEELEINGIVREQAVNASAAMAVSSGNVTLDALTGTVGNSRLSASGQMRGDSSGQTIGVTGSELDFQWSVNSPDLSALLPELSGRIVSEGTLGGTPDFPAVKATLTVNEARYQQYAIQSLAADVALDLSAGKGATPSSVDLGAQGVQMGQVQIASASAELKGTLDSHRLSLQLDSNQGRLKAALTGAYETQEWSGVWQKGAIEPLDMPGWILQQPHVLSLSSSVQTVERACWAVEQEAGSRLCFNAGRDAGETTVDFTLSALAFRYFESLFPDDLVAEGALSARGEVRQSDGSPVRIDAEVSSSASRFYRDDTDADDLAQSISIDPSVVALKGTLAELAASLEIPFSAGGGLRGEVGVLDVQTPAQADLNGTVTASFPDLSFLELLSPEIEKVIGSAALDVTLGGTLQAPRPTGDLRSKGVSLSLATPGIRVDDASVTASADSDGVVKVEGSAVSDGGLLRVKGVGQLAVIEKEGATAVELASFRAMVTGEEFQFWNTGDASVWGSPAMALSVLDGKLRFEGDFVVPRASITPTQLPPSAARPTGDQVIVLTSDDSAEAVALAAVSMPVFGSLRTSLGDEVSIDAFGFKGRITGDLGIELAPGKPILASGELNVVDGEYRAFGQGLVVERGQFLFAGGDIENPGLNIRAQRRPAADVVVGVDVTGQLQAPSLNIFSEPTMSSSNQLAWLVLGRPFENTSGAETDYIAQAALMLGIQGGDYLAKGFGEKLGLDTVGIETGSGEAGAQSDVNQAALVVGKYLTPKLYISYGVGLLDSISTVKLRYQISDRWNVATESSPIASGGDINFTIER